jgi:hypothetical protein
MSTQKQEIRHIAPDRHEHMFAAIIAIATGLELEEVVAGLPKRLLKNGGFYGRDFRECFEHFGFDCSRTFKRFDKDTERIAVIRYGPSKRALVENRKALRKRSGDPKAQLPKEEMDWWDVAVYYDGWIYKPLFSDRFPLTDPIVKYWRITSMMQVWLSDL